ncbi:MAG: amino acid adenylation domain-containing protein [Lacunisphaera sp.]
MPTLDDIPGEAERGSSPRLQESFESQAKQRPLAVAVEFSGSTLTYRELNTQASRLAHRLLSYGVGPGTCVALCLPRSTDLIVGVLAVLKAGAAYVPLDPTYPADRLSLMLADANPVAVLTQAALKPLLPTTSVPMFLWEGSATLDDPATLLEREVAASDSPAYILFTSGSTGKPKGVVMPHRPLVNLMRWQQRTLPLSTGDRVLQFAPLSFDVSFQEIFTTLSEGGTLVLIKDELRRDPQGLVRFLIEQRIQRLYLPFVALQQIAEVVATGGPVPVSLQAIITAGEQLQISDEIRTLFRLIPTARLHNHYGPTETHVATAYTLVGDTAAWPTLPPIGRAIDHTTVHLLDDQRRPVAAGAQGEIYLSGHCVAQGYLNRPDLTAERFLPDPIHPGERMYRTGDLGQVRADGEIEFLGRADDQVKIRGHRVELGEVEAVLRRCPGIRECAVAAQTRGIDKILVAYFIAGVTPAPPAEEIRSFLVANLPEPMVPAWYVPLSALPLTPSGKLNRRALPAPALITQVATTSRGVFANGVERTIADAWEAVLGFKGVGATDNFFAVGGTSLMVAQVQRRLQTALGRDIPITLLFQFVTIRQLAEQLTNKAINGMPPPATTAAPDRAALQREALARRQATMRPKIL